MRSRWARSPLTLGIALSVHDPNQRAVPALIGVKGAGGALALPVQSVNSA